MRSEGLDIAKVLFEHLQKDQKISIYTFQNQPHYEASLICYTINIYLSDKGSYREIVLTDSSSMLFVAATSSNRGLVNLATRFARTQPLTKVRGMCLISKAPRAVILPYLTIALTITQALPTDGANCRDTICSPSPKCMIWVHDPTIYIYIYIYDTFTSSSFF